MSEADDAQARKARADAIRRARDARNVKIEGGATSDDSADVADDESDDSSPNYVDLIDQRMRKDQRDQ